MKRFSRRLLIEIILAVVVFGALGIWAFFIEPDRLIVKEYDIRLKNWSPQADGLKIVAVSDIHGGSNFIDEAKIRLLVEKINQQNADIIVLLGDFVSQQHLDRTKLKMPMETIAGNLKGLRAKHGVYAVIGNHDNWYDGAAVRRELETIGYRVLEREAASFEYNGATVRLLGIPDVLKEPNSEIYRQNAVAALARLDAKTGNLVALTHNPDAAIFLKETKGRTEPVDLLLAGHTHGGQCRFPLVGAPIVPSEFGQLYAAGHVRDGEQDVFVTTGVGTSLLPVRFNVPPEISVLRIFLER